MASCLMFQYTGDLKLKIIFLKYFVLFSFLHFFEAFIIILSKGLWNNHDSYFRCGINYIDMFVLILDLILYIQIITTGFYFASVYILIPTIKLWKCCFQCKAIYKKLYVIKTCSNTVIASILAFFLFLFFLANFIEIIFENFSRKACVNKNDTDKILTRLYGIRLCGSFKCPKDYECRELEITDTSVQIRWLFSTLFESIIISFTTMTSKLSTAFIYNINDRFDTSQFVSFLFPCVIPPLLYKIAEGIILSNFILNFMKKDIRTKFHTKFIQLRNKQFLNAPSSREVDVNNYDRKDKNFFEFFKIAYQCIASISSYLLSGHYSTMAAHEFRKKSEKIKKYLEPRVKTFYFSLFEISLILANTILLMSYRVDHHTTYYIICIVQIFITPIFTFLAILRWIAYGRNEFRKLRLFIPDFIVTIFSFIDVFLFFTKNMIYGLNSLKLFFVVSLIYHTRENKSLNRYFKLQGKMLKSFFILLIPILIAMATVLGLFGVQHQLM
ncbi:hypothetical protein HZS_3001 [Henneguya salminicola]|nr:hypothetical protein HZS_3001 [Henneguya salminicola]